MSRESMIEQRLKEIEEFLYLHEEDIWDIATTHTIPGYADSVVWLNNLAKGNLELVGATYLHGGEYNNPAKVKDSLNVYALAENWQDSIKQVSFEDCVEMLIFLAKNDKLRPQDKEQFEKLGLGKFEPSKVDKVKLLETIENMSDEQITILKRLIVPIKEEQLQNVGWEEFDNNYGQIVDEALEKSEIILEQLFSKEEER